MIFGEAVEGCWPVKVRFLNLVIFVGGNENEMMMCWDTFCVGVLLMFTHTIT